MKKALIILTVIGALFLNSCTDNTEELIKNEKENRIEFQLIDKDEVETPTTKGQD